MSPKLACCNFIRDIHKLKAFAQANGFEGIDWSFHIKSLPKNPAEETALFKAISSLYPLEVRYHCAFPKTDMGDDDREKAAAAEDIFRSVCRLVSKLGGGFITMHIGLGRHSTNHLSWERSLERVADLVQFANGLGVRLCLGAAVTLGGEVHDFFLCGFGDRQFTGDAPFAHGDNAMAHAQDFRKLG